MLINGTPCHVRDLCRHDILTITEDDKRGTSSESEPGTMLLFGTGPDSSFAKSMSKGEDDNTKNNSDPAGGDIKDPMSKCPPFLQRSTHQKWAPPSCYVYDHAISEVK